MSNADDRCVQCGKARFDWGVHPGSGAPGSRTHAFVEPVPQPVRCPVHSECADDAYSQCQLAAGHEPKSHDFEPQPAPSGDEAKVREIANKWYAQYVGSHLPALQHGILPGAVREALADGARAEREACVRAVADVDCLDRSELAMREKCAAAIARRGSEGT